MGNQEDLVSNPHCRLNVFRPLEEHLALAKGNHNIIWRALARAKTHSMANRIINLKSDNTPSNLPYGS